MRAAAASLRAALGIVAEPEPEPPKRRKRKALTILVLVGTVGFAAKKVAARRGGDEARDYSGERPAEPVEPAPTAQAA